MRRMGDLLGGCERRRGSPGRGARAPSSDLPRRRACGRGCAAGRTDGTSGSASRRGSRRRGRAGARSGSSRPEQRLRRERAERDDHLRLDRVDLLEQERLAGRDLVRLGIAIAGRPALDARWRCRPRRARSSIASIIFVSSCPARPTNGIPWMSSSAPGASPTNIRSASGFPTPNTTCFRPSVCSLQRVQSPMSSRMGASSSAAERANVTGTTAASATRSRCPVAPASSDLPRPSDARARSGRG